MEKKIKLSDKQKEVIRYMRNGWQCGVRSLSKDNPFRIITFKSWTIYSLYRHKLIDLDEGSIFHYQLTELGKTIEL